MLDGGTWVQLAPGPINTRELAVLEAMNVGLMTYVDKDSNSMGRTFQLNTRQRNMGPTFARGPKWWQWFCQYLTTLSPKSIYLLKKSNTGRTLHSTLSFREMKRSAVTLDNTLFKTHQFMLFWCCFEEERNITGFQQKNNSPFASSKKVTFCLNWRLVTLSFHSSVCE